MAESVSRNGGERREHGRKWRREKEEENRDGGVTGDDGGK